MENEKNMRYNERRKENLKSTYKNHQEEKEKLPKKSKDDFLDGFTYYDEDFSIRPGNASNPIKKTANTFSKPHNEDDFLKGFNFEDQEAEPRKPVRYSNQVSTPSENVPNTFIQIGQAVAKTANSVTKNISQKSDATILEESWNTTPTQPTAKEEKEKKSDATIMEEYWEDSLNTSKQKNEKEWVEAICKDVSVDFNDDASLWAELSDIEASYNGKKNSKWYQRLANAWAVGNLEVYEKVEEHRENLREQIESILDNKTSSRDDWTNFFAKLHYAGDTIVEPILNTILFNGPASLQESFSNIGNYAYNKSIDLSTSYDKNGYINSQHSNTVSTLKFGRLTIDKNGCGIIATSNALTTLGNKQDICDIIYSFENKGEVFGGLLGTNHYAIRKYFKDIGYNVVSYSGDKDIYSATAGSDPGADVYILTYWHPDVFEGMHTISINRNTKGFYEAHNENSYKSYDPHKYYNLYDFIKSINGIPTSLLCISK